MKKKKSNPTFLDDLYKQYKVVVSNDRTFEERLSFKTSKLGIFLTSFLYTAVLIGTTICLVFFTPLKEYVPGYSSLELLKSTTEQSFKLDSIIKVTELNNQYYNSIIRVLTGELDTIAFNRDSIINEINAEKLSSELSPSKEDSLLRKYIDEEDKFNLTSNQLLIENKILFQPVQGEITQNFNKKEDHFAIDIAVDEGTPVKSISEGRVLFSDWTVQTGYVIIIDHGDMLTSVYKHNSSLVKKQNETVNAGEIVALSGNHGTLTSGPHLHFEVWKNGRPIDPMQLFNFK
ncbi:MAG: peptidase M23 [Flavobacteriaceae bacterium]|nr:peptidase M23 [Flavobacteriaceae bacterium]|tara:strand:- start:908 stop:1774 length:867 start_codon:yes stop_codon:yes gene_type:complete